MGRREGDDFENSEEFLEVQGAVARKIKRLRMERNLTQRQLSHIADVSGPHFGLIEAGVGNVTLLVLVKIAKALGVSVSDLFEGVAGARSAVDSAIVRLAATAEKIERHFESRRDEFGRFGDELKDFMKEYRGALSASAHDGCRAAPNAATPFFDLSRTYPRTLFATLHLNPQQNLGFAVPYMRQSDMET